MVAEEAERRSTKYAHLEHNHHFIPMAVEFFGILDPQARSFIQELGCCLDNITITVSLSPHLIQRISVAVQRGNLLPFLCPATPSTIFVFLHLFSLLL